MGFKGQMHKKQSKQKKGRLIKIDLSEEKKWRQNTWIFEEPWEHEYIQ